MNLQVSGRVLDLLSRDKPIRFFPNTLQMLALYSYRPLIGMTAMYRPSARPITHTSVMRASRSANPVCHERRTSLQKEDPAQAGVV